jgi:hypothetical protein
LKLSFNQDEVIKAFKLKTNQYIVDRDMIAEKLGVEIKQRTLKDLGVIFGCLQAVKIADELLETYSQHCADNLSGVQLARKDLDGVNTTIAIFTVTVKYLGVGTIYLDYC